MNSNKLIIALGLAAGIFAIVPITFAADMAKMDHSNSKMDHSKMTTKEAKKPAPKKTKVAKKSVKRKVAGKTAPRY